MYQSALKSDKRGYYCLFRNSFLKRAALPLFAAALLSGCSKKTTNENLVLNDAGKALTSSTAATPGYYTIATYNLRRITTEAAPQRNWSVRLPLVKDMIGVKYGFDIVGVQEPLASQIADLKSALGTSYSNFGTSDHGPNDNAYQHQDIFYKNTKFTLKASGSFWMAPGTGGRALASHSCNKTNDLHPWDSYYHACVCTWGKFQDKTTGREFFVFNTHFDPGDPNGGTATGVTARLESGKLMLLEAQKRALGLPYIIMGDFNSNQNVANGPYSYLQNAVDIDESYEIAPTHSPKDANGNNLRQTGNWWDPTIKGNSQIDHIFVTTEAHNNWSLLNHMVLWDKYNTSSYTNVMPSDHNAVKVEMKFPVSATPIADGKYKIIAEHSQMAVVVKNGSTASSALVVQAPYTADTNTNDEWVFTKVGTSGQYKITNVKSNLAMNVQGHSTADLAAIIQYAYNGTDMLYNDEWFLIDVGNGYYRIVSRSSGYGLNVDAASMTSGAQVWQYHYSAVTAAAKNMHFKMVAIP